MKTHYKNIFLIGMPGSGKSYWAEQIAAAYGLQCIDLDHIISVRTGHTVAAFFERFGEASFRQLEQLTLKQVSEVFAQDTVIACGGGTPCFFDNLKHMKARGLVIYLDAPIEQLIERLEQENGQRPLLNSSNWRSTLAELLEYRSPFYERADITLPAKSLSIADFAPLIGNALL